MPLSVFRKIKLGEATPTMVSLQLANRSVKYPRGVIEDVIMKVDKSFIILDMEEDKEVPIILGRPFLATGNTLIDIRQGKLTLRVQDDEITFNMTEAVTCSKECFRVDKVKEHMMETSVTKESPINNFLPEESICIIETPLTPWYAHIVNYLACSIIPAKFHTKRRNFCST